MDNKHTFYKWLGLSAIGPVLVAIDHVMTVYSAMEIFGVNLMAIIILIGWYCGGMALAYGFATLDDAIKRKSRKAKISAAQERKAEKERKQAEWEANNPDFNMPFVNAIEWVSEYLRIKKGSTDLDCKIAIKEIIARFNSGELMIEGLFSSTLERCMIESNIKLSYEAKNYEDGFLYLRFFSDDEYVGLYDYRRRNQEAYLLGKEEGKEKIAYRQITLPRKQVHNLWPKF